MFAVGRKGGFGAQTEGVGAGAGFTEGVGRHPLAGRQFGKILFLLRLRAEVEQGLRADAAMRAACHAEAAEPGQLLLHAHRGGLVQPQAAILLRHAHAEQSQFPRLAEKLLREPLLLMLQRFEIRQDLLVHEFLRGLRHEPLVRGQILGRKHQSGVGFGEQKISADQMGGQWF